jgi:hypothetical protein
MRSHEGEGQKTFEVAFRGYQRGPVDEYVTRLHGWLIDSEARAEHAVEAAATAVGERAAEILRAALEVGEQAQAEAEAMKVAAVENAQAEADRVMEEARQKIDELQKSIDRLAVRRANVLNELGRLQQYLAGAAPGGSADDADGDASEVDSEADADEDDEHELTVSAMSAAPDPEAVFTNGDRPVSPSST